MKLLLAPIQSMTIAPYRNAFAEMFGGIDEYYSPFIATAEQSKISRALLKDILPENNSPKVKVIPQLLGNNGVDFKAFASAITDLGYDEINWNIGCPFPMVANKKKGSGLLPYSDIIKEFLDIVCKDKAYVLTVKMRLGLNNAEEGLKVMEVLNEYPLGGVIIHARTGNQMYTGTVDFSSFEALSAAGKHSITYNGDIYTLADFHNVTGRFPAIKSYMLGRGALRDPFLPAAIKGTVTPSEDRMSIIKKFHNEIFNYYKANLSGNKHLCDKMKEFWSYMSIHIDKDGKLIKKIKKCHSESSYLNIINNVLDNSTLWNELPYK